jgi:hypothetical protein
MSIEVVCEQCGTVLRAPDDAAGRVGRCKSCGQRIRVPAPPRKTAEEEARELDPLYRRHTAVQDHAAVSGPTRGFWEDAARSFVLSGKAGNLIPLAFAAALQMVTVLLRYATCIGLVVDFVIFGWLAAFYMNIIRETASGEDDIPTMRWESGLWDDVLAPLVTFIASLAAVMSPAILCWIATYYLSSEPLGMLATVIAFAGVFAWPAALLVVSIGGAATAFHLDAIILTIFKSFLPYVAVVGLIAATMIFQSLSAKHLYERTGGGVAAAAVQSVITQWAWIVSMRCVGLYYRHFKDRFPWSAE